MKKLWILAAFVAATVSLAQTTTTYTGTIKDLDGVTVTSGRITFQLNAPSGGSIPGIGSFTSSIVSCLINGSGSPVAGDGVSPCVITNNSALTPTGTSYTICRQPYNTVPGSCFVTFANGGTVDISTLVPTPSTQPNYGVASLGANNTWGGTNAFPNGITGDTPYTGRALITYVNSPSSPLTWTAPGWNLSLTDSATVSQTSAAPGDANVTPAQRVVSSDSGVNDTAPYYGYHNCNFLTTTTPAPCVGAFFVSQNNANDGHNGVWAINPVAIQYAHSTHSLTYGVEANVFNESGADPGAPDTPSGSMSAIFGYAATIGGNVANTTNGTAAYLVTDLNAGSYWYTGLYVQRAIYAAVEAGPDNGGSGLQFSFVSNPQGQATNVQNYASVPERDLASVWTGSGNALESLQRSYIPGAGSFPVGCYTFTWNATVRQAFCDDGSWRNAGNVIIPSTVTGFQGSTGTKLAIASGSFTNGNLRSTDANGNEVDTGSPATGTSGNCYMGNGPGVASTYQSCPGSGSLPHATDSKDKLAVNGSGAASIITPATDVYNVVLNGGWDNTGVTDESSAFATLLTSGITEPIYFPPGTYNFNSGIHPVFTSSTGSGINIIGAGIGQTIWQSTCSGALPLIWFDYGTNNVTSGSYQYGPKVVGVTLKDTSGSGACNSGMRITQVENFHLYDIEGRNFNGKVYSTGTVTVTNGSTTVTSSGATFTAAMVAGQAQLQVAGNKQFVCGQTSTTLILCTPWQQQTASGTAYALDYGGTALLFDGGQNYIQYGMVDGFWSQGNMVAIGSVPFASTSSNVGTSRIWIRGGFINGGVPGSRLTDSSCAAFGDFTDTITWDIACNNAAWGGFWENTHDNKITGQVEFNNTWTPVTTCNGGVAAQSCNIGHQLTADTSGHGYGNSIETDEIYKAGVAVKIDSTAASFISIISPKWMNSGGASGNLVDFSFGVAGTYTNGCPANASGNNATIIAWNCIHFTSTVNIN